MSILQDSSSPKQLQKLTEFLTGSDMSLKNQECRSKFDVKTSHVMFFPKYHVIFWHIIFLDFEIKYHVILWQIQMSETDLILWQENMTVRYLVGSTWNFGDKLFVEFDQKFGSCSIIW